MWPNTDVFIGDADETDPLEYDVKMFGSRLGFLNTKHQLNCAC